jgi:protoporphyrinogen oxidase
MRVAVIGAGPAGLTAALQLSHGGVSVDIYEAGSQVGGLARSIDLWGERVDFGPHRFFSTDTRVNRFWLEIVGSDYVMIDRLTRIHFNEELFQYPLKPWDVVTKLGLVETTRALLSYAKSTFSRGSKESVAPSFENWVVRRFGQRLYETFFKSYSEKLWGIPCTELSEDFAAQRIRKFNLREAILNAFSYGTRNDHRTLADSFAYPLGGTGAVYERIASRITDLGGNVLLDRPVSKVLTENGKVTGVRCVNGKLEHYDHVISTMPITLLVKGMENVPQPVHEAASQLTFRNTILIYLRVEDPNLFQDQWLYIHDSHVKVGRVTNFNNWGTSKRPNASTTILCCEYWCNQSDSTWLASDDTLVERASSELRQIGLVKNQLIINSHVIRIPRCYPVYQIGYQQHVDVISSFLRSIDGLSVIGRYGAFKYNNQDHSILMGLLAADNLLHSDRHNLWELNSDFDTYQEQSLITDSGLVPT